MQENIRLDLRLFLNMVNLIKFGDEMSEEERKNLESIVIPQIEEKLDKTINRINYTRCMEATTSEDKQRFMKEYLKRYILI